MIVFPLIRSVGLKAATASSRVETLPMFSRDESRRMNLNDDVVYRWLRLGPLHQLHPGLSRSLVHYYDRLHMNCLSGDA